MSTVLDRPGPASPSPLTVLPERDPKPAPQQLRTLSGFRREDLLALGGAFASAASIVLLLFGRLVPLEGTFGMVIVGYVLFLVIYGFLVSLDDDRQAVIDKLMAVVLATGAVIAGISLVSVVVSTIVRGWSVLPKSNFYTEDMSVTGPLDPLSQGGISHAIVGTLIIISISLVITVPLGMTCAVYLTEARSRSSRIVRTIVDAMTALPSILAGLFIFTTWILILGNERSGLAAALATSIMMLPIVIRSSDVVLRLVPGNLREAAAALGASQWRTVWHVVLPTARSGLVTAVILGVARGVGETAPVLLTSGFTAGMNTNPTSSAMMSLPLATFDFVRSPQQALRDRGFATAAVLMALVLVLFTMARLLGGRPAGRVTPRGARRLAARSSRDLARIDDRRPEVA